MENGIQSIRSTVEDAAETMRRISALCDMLGDLGDSNSVIPKGSLCYTMSLIRDILAEQAGALDALSWPTGKVVAA